MLTVSNGLLNDEYLPTQNWKETPANQIELISLS